MLADAVDQVLPPWDVRALDAADAVTEQRVQQHHASLQRPTLPAGGAVGPRRAGHPGPRHGAGESPQIQFEMTTLYPAVSTAIGPT
ncbi:hypothetical protein ACFYNL_36685 [Streptomyces sp. NPDC007808]|uniref:hypothetical protein n=1 Tax=Streptomyces sp. NPDC007808 TaxID=3364779 RepID=UPI00368E2FD3